MTSKYDGPGKGPAKPVSEPAAAKKPTAIIDLKATEIETKDAAKAAGKPEEKPSAAAGAGGSVPQTKPSEAARPAGPAATAAAAASGKPGDVKASDAKSAASTASAPAAATASSQKTGEQKPAETKPATAAAAKPAGASADAAKSVPAKPAPSPAAATVQSRSSFSLGSMLSHTLAGVVGGFLALLGADTIASQLGLGGQAQAPAPEFTQRLATLEQALKQRPAPAVPADLAQKLAAAEARLADLDQLSKTVKQISDGQSQLANEARALGEKVSGSSAADAQARLVKLEETLAALSAAALSDPQKGRIPQLAAITGQVKDLEASLANQLTALRKQVGQELDSRLSASAEAAESARSGTQRIDRDMSAVKTEAARLGQRLDGLKAEGDRLAVQVKGVEDTASSLKTSLDTLKSEVAQQLKTVAKPQDVAATVAPLVTKLASVEQGLQGVVKNEEGRRSNAERIVLALELANLKRAIERGGRFAAELAEVKKVSGGKLELAALEKVKEQGVPTTPDLVRDFRDVAHAVIEADAEPAEGSVVDRLLSGAKSIVRVRKVNAGADDKSAEAIVARMEAALKDQRFAAVVEESKKLSAKALEPARAWLAKLEGRAAVDRAVAAVEAQLKSSLGAKTE